MPQCYHLLFTLMLVHGHCPNSMLLGTMVPLARFQGTTCSDNFRAITLSSILQSYLI